MNLVANGERPNKQKLDQLYELYSEALLVVESDNDVLEALDGVLFGAMFTVVPWMLLQAKANVTLEALKLLTEELEKAKKELSHAKTKRAIHAVASFFEEMFPEISTMARAGIYIGDVVLDKLLPSGEPSTMEKYRGDVVPGVKQFAEAVHHIPEYSHRAHEVAERTGKVATIATFYFDYEEVAEGSERVEKLEELTEDAKRKYDELVRIIETDEPRLMAFLEHGVEIVNDIRQTATVTRNDLGENITKYQYSVTQPVVWTTAGEP